MPPGKKSTEKKSPGNKPLRKLPPGKLSSGNMLSQENCPPEHCPPQENSPRKNCFTVDIILQLFIASSFRGVSRTPEISIMDLLVTLVNGII